MFFSYTSLLDPHQEAPAVKWLKHFHNVTVYSKFVSILNQPASGTLWSNSDRILTAFPCSVTQLRPAVFAKDILRRQENRSSDTNWKPSSVSLWKLIRVCARMCKLFWGERLCSSSFSPLIDPSAWPLFQILRNIERCSSRSSGDLCVNGGRVKRIWRMNSTSSGMEAVRASERIRPGAWSSFILSFEPTKLDGAAARGPEETERHGTVSISCRRLKRSCLVVAILSSRPADSLWQNLFHISRLPRGIHTHICTYTYVSLVTQVDYVTIYHSLPSQEIGARTNFLSSLHRTLDEVFQLSLKIIKCFPYQLRSRKEIFPKPKIYLHTAADTLYAAFDLVWLF